VHERYRQTTDEPAVAYSERVAKNGIGRCYLLAPNLTVNAGNVYVIAARTAGMKKLRHSCYNR